MQQLNLAFFLLALTNTIALAFMLWSFLQMRKEQKEMIAGVDENKFVVSRISKYLVRMMLVLMPLTALILLFAAQLVGEFTGTILGLGFPFAGGIVFLVHGSWSLSVHQNEIQERNLFRLKRQVSFREIYRVEQVSANKIICYAEAGKLFSIKKNYLNYKAFVLRLQKAQTAGADQLVVD